MTQFRIRLAAISVAFALLLSASGAHPSAQAATNTAAPTRAVTPGKSATTAAEAVSPTLALILGLGGGASGAGNDLYLFDISSKTGKSGFSSRTSDSFFNTLSWSPDGNYLAFYNHASGSIAISDPGGGNIKNITFGNVFAWTADSTQLTVSTGSSTPLTNIDIATGQSTPLFAVSKTIKYVDYLRWSPDGKRLLYIGSAASASGEEMHVIDADGANDKIVLPASNIARYAMWSADGQKIAYLIGGGNVPTASINIVDLTTNKTAKIAQGALAADWSPDGKTFAYADGNGQLFLINADGSNKRAISRPADLTKPIVAIAWQPPVKPKVALPVSTSAATAAAISGAADGMQTYIASDKSFSFNYPTGWTFQDKATVAKLPGLDTTVFESPYAVIVTFISDATMSQLFASSFAGGTPLEINGKKVARADKCPLESKSNQIAYLMTLEAQKSVLVCAFPKSADEMKGLESALEAILASVQAPAAQ